MKLWCGRGREVVWRLVEAIERLLLSGPVQPLSALIGEDLFLSVQILLCLSLLWRIVFSGYRGQTLDPAHDRSQTMVLWQFPGQISGR
ncbi:unknown protein [Desulfotalea psychrophila LSv54]|uniref:Uncharacterized protein n=1 Tax=Desulfotalea psychrophila (strain LSv54 / DSM 12343) TaxID=177439 RepID=Q6APF9_DESPS|nr:unknown protein [Desulfotalea psychrophila LSv54]